MPAPGAPRALGAVSIRLQVPLVPRHPGRPSAIALPGAGGAWPPGSTSAHAPASGPAGWAGPRRRPGTSPLPPREWRTPAAKQVAELPCAVPHRALCKGPRAPHRPARPGGATWPVTLLPPASAEFPVPPVSVRAPGDPPRLLAGFGEHCWGVCGSPFPFWDRRRKPKSLIWQYCFCHKTAGNFLFLNFPSGEAVNPRPGKRQARGGRTLGPSTRALALRRGAAVPRNRRGAGRPRSAAPRAR